MRNKRLEQCILSSQRSCMSPASCMNLSTAVAGVGSGKSVDGRSVAGKSVGTSAGGCRVESNGRLRGRLCRMDSMGSRIE